MEYDGKGRVCTVIVHHKSGAKMNHVDFFSRFALEHSDDLNDRMAYDSLIHCADTHDHSAASSSTDGQGLTFQSLLQNAIHAQQQDKPATLPTLLTTTTTESPKATHECNVNNCHHCDLRRRVSFSLPHCPCRQAPPTSLINVADPSQPYSCAANQPNPPCLGGCS